MRAILNRQVFTARLFDSGALGVLASVVHQFTEPGRYEVVIRQGDVTRRSASFEVSSESQNMQLDIDLAAPAASVRPSAKDDCDCKGGPEAPAPDVRVISPNGYVLFYVSHGEGGYSARVGRLGAEKPVFDSTALDKGDLFALSLLAPTRYRMSNRAGKATGYIVVTSSPEALRKLATLQPAYVETSRDAFSPSDLNVVSGQGIVFRIGDTSRVVIEQIEDPPEDPKPTGDRGRRFVVRRPPQPRKTGAA